MPINKLLVFIAFFFIFSCKNENKSRVDYLPYYIDATFTPMWYENTVPSNTHIIPDFKLTDQNGDTITNKTFENKVYITDFFFTSCPGICKKMTSNMFLLQKEFIDNKDVLLLSHSVMPETDSVSTLANYAEAYEINNLKWHLVTGDRKEIYNLGRNSYFVEEDLGLKKDENDFLHTENFILIDKNRHIRGIYNGLNKTAIKQLITDINTLLKE